MGLRSGRDSNPRPRPAKRAAPAGLTCHSPKNGDLTVKKHGGGPARAHH